MSDSDCTSATKLSSPSLTKLTDYSRTKMHVNYVPVLNCAHPPRYWVFDTANTIAALFYAWIFSSHSPWQTQQRPKQSRSLEFHIFGLFLFQRYLLKSWALTRMCSWSDLQDLHFKSSRGDLIYFHVLQHCPLFQVTLICLAFVQYTRRKHFLNVSRIISTVDVLVVLHSEKVVSIYQSKLCLFHKTEISIYVAVLFPMEILHHRCYLFRAFDPVPSVRNNFPFSSPPPPSLPLPPPFPSSPQSFRWTDLLQMVIQMDQPLVNDHQQGPASCKCSSGRTGSLQMIIRMD